MLIAMRKRMAGDATPAEINACVEFVLVTLCSRCDVRRVEECITFVENLKELLYESEPTLSAEVKHEMFPHFAKESYVTVVLGGLPETDPKGIPTPDEFFALAAKRYPRSHSLQ